MNMDKLTLANMPFSGKVAIVKTGKKEGYVYDKKYIEKDLFLTVLLENMLGNPEKVKMNEGAQTVIRFVEIDMNFHIVCKRVSKEKYDKLKD